MKKNFLLERYFAEFEEKFIKYMLCASDCDPLTIKQLSDLLPEEDRKEFSFEFNHQSLEYTQAEGCYKLREKIIDVFYDRQILSIENILIGTPEELIYITMRSLLRKNDEVIVSFPGYQSLYEVAQSIGCRVKRWEMNPENWEFEVNDLIKMISPETKMIVINFPHNPSGFALSQENMVKIIEELEKLADQNILLFSDEMYMNLDITQKSADPVCNIYKNGFSLCGMSKGFSMPGIRIGWLSSQNTELLKEIKAYKDFTTICSSCSSEIIARYGLSVTTKILERNIETVKRNISYAKKFYEKHPGIFRRYSFPRIGSVGLLEMKLVLGNNSNDQAMGILKEKGLLMLPCSVFEMERYEINVGFGIFRIGYGRSFESFKNAISQLKNFVLESKNHDDVDE